LDFFYHGYFCVDITVRYRDRFLGGEAAESLLQTFRYIIQQLVSCDFGNRAKGRIGCSSYPNAICK